MAWRNLTKNMQELRVHLCQTGPASQGARMAGSRDFVMSTYQELKKANPRLPILVRECEGVTPKLIARYDFGVEESVALDGLDKAAIIQKLEQLVKKGESMPRSTESS